MAVILTKRLGEVKHYLRWAGWVVGLLLLMQGCFPDLPPEAERPPEPGVTVSPEQHQGRARSVAEKNYDSLLLFERYARKRSHQWVFDRQGLRFEEQNNEVVLVVTGRYFWKFNADKSNPQAEGEELWQKLIGPFLEEIFLKGRFQPDFERVRITVRFERESPTGKKVTQEGIGIFNIKAWKPEEGSKPKETKNFLSRSESQIDGQKVIISDKVSGDKKRKE